MSGKRERWTDEADDTLRRLHAQGLTMSAIGERMGKKKNQIVGRCFRIGLKRPETQPASLRTKANAKPKAVGAARGKPPQKALPLPKPVLVRNPRPSDSIWRPKTCQFPVGDPGEPGFHFCGAALEPADGRSYCPEHHRRCYLPPKDKGEKTGDFKMYGWGGQAA